MGRKRQKVVTTPPLAAVQPAAGGSAGARAYAAASTAVVTAALAPGSRLPSVGALDGPSVQAYMAGELAALLTRSATLLTGPRQEAFTASGGGSFDAETWLQRYRNFATMCAGLKAAWRAASGAHRHWLEGTLAAAAAAEAPLSTAGAWTLLPFSAADEPAEAVLRQLRDVLTVCDRMRVATLATKRAEAAADGGRELDPAFVAACAEYGQSLHAGLAFVHAALLLAAQLRAAAPFADYAAAGERLVSLAGGYAGDLEAAYTRRAEWTTRALRAGVVSRGHLPDGGAVVYLRQEATLRSLVEAAAAPATPVESAPLCSSPPRAGPAHA